MVSIESYGEENVTRALDMEDVDYVEHFASSELAARIRAALRQRAGLGRAAQPQPYVVGELSIEYACRPISHCWAQAGKEVIDRNTKPDNTQITMPRVGQ